METIVVTRHRGLVGYLQSRGIIAEDTPVIEHATPELVRGKRVIGVLPLHLAVEAAEVIEVPMNIPAEMRGVDLTAEQTAQFAAPPRAYVVQQSVDIAGIESDCRERGYTRWTIQVPDPCSSIGCGFDEPIEVRDSLAEALALAVVYSSDPERTTNLGEIIVSPTNKDGGMALPPVGAVRGKVATLGLRPSVKFPERAR